MGLRLPNLLVLTYTIFFVAIFAPGHTRGALKVPGSLQPELAMAVKGCSFCAAFGSRKTPESTTDLPIPADTPEPDSGHCIVCLIKGMLTVPPEPDFPPVVTLTLRLAALRLQEAVPVPAFEMIAARGPPAWPATIPS